MKSLQPKRNDDSLIIPDGSYVEPGIVKNGKQISASLKYELAYFKIHVNADAIITFKDRWGNLVSNMAVTKGRVPYPMSEISACDQTFFIVHDGVQSAQSQEMTSHIY